MLSIEMLPVEHGDSLLVTYGDPDAPHHVLIDGGPYFVYRDSTFLERKTLLHRAQTPAEQGNQLKLVVVIHIDADHIEGIVKLFGNPLARLRIHDVCNIASAISRPLPKRQPTCWGRFMARCSVR